MPKIAEKFDCLNGAVVLHGSGTSQVSGSTGSGTAQLRNTDRSKYKCS